MRKRNLLASAAFALALAGTLGPARADEAPAPAAPPPQRIVEVAICLDTSGSMEGLLDAARRKLWAIVNDLALAKPVPRFRVALLTFGNDGHPAEVGWVRVDSGLTEDLDLISQQLFALTTNGGTELVGRVVDAATRQLSWNPASDALKLLFVAGNESADQDREVSFRDACKRAIEKGIIVNSIYCGSPGHGDAAAWQEVARLADGQYMAIDQDNGTVAIATPFDERIAALSVSLNTTYVPLGGEGELKKENQAAQDRNAAAASPSAASERGAAKASRLYRCDWDLVDGVCRNGLKLEELKEEDLPEELRKMTLEERRAFVAEMDRKRSEIQKEIAAIQVKRQEFIAQEMAKQAGAGDQAFDKAIREALRKQAESKGFTFEEK
ncbi:MAG: vWA domain-containing protein [Planctomycetaceae bacterium]